MRPGSSSVATGGGSLQYRRPLYAARGSAGRCATSQQTNVHAAQPSLAGLIAALRADHSAIRAALHGIEDAVRADDRERARAAIGGLRERLDAHHALEERELHPALAGSLCDAPQVVSLFEDAHLRHSGR